MSRLIAALLTCLLLALLSGCGNKGPLTLPPAADNQLSNIN